MAKQSKPKKLGREQLMNLYSEFILKNGRSPVTVFSFMKDLDFNEEEFYHYFSGFAKLENEYLKHFFTKAMELSQTLNGYNEMNAREKLLNLYFIFVENITMNRSLVLYLLGDSLHSAGAIKKLHYLKPLYQFFAKSLHFDKMNQEIRLPAQLNHISNKLRTEILWVHFISVIDFWKNDTSPSFESTDMYIEKTIDTGFEVLQATPLKKIVDVGKFLFKERFQTAV